MTDEILKELWGAKGGIAKDHSWDIDNLAKYYLAKQANITGRGILKRPAITSGHT